MESLYQTKEKLLIAFKILMISLLFFKLHNSFIITKITKSCGLLKFRNETVLIFSTFNQASRWEENVEI